LGKSLVSVVVPTLNSERFLKGCLMSIREQTWRNIEVIVIDHYSADMTKKIAQSFGAKIFESDAQRSEARNFGARKAKGSLLFFVDSDMELEPSVIDECIKEIEKGCDAVVIPEVSVGDSFWAKCKALEKACYAGDNMIEAGRFLRRNAFEDVSGYDAQLEACEDWDLNQRLRKAGYRIGRINALIKHHEGRMGLRETMLKKHYYGTTLERYRNRHPEEASQQLRLIRPAFMKNWKRLAKDPIYALGMFLMKTCEFAAGWLGTLHSRKDECTRKIQEPA